MVNIESIRNKHHPGYRNVQTEFQIIFIQPYDSIGRSQFQLSDLKGLERNAEQTIQIDRRICPEKVDVDLEEWKTLLRKDTDDSDIPELNVPMPEYRFYKGVDLQDSSAVKSLATKIHHNFGAPRWAKMSNFLRTAQVPQLLYDECRKHCENCTLIGPCDRAPLIRTSSIPLVKDFGEMLTIDFMEWLDLSILHIVDVFSRVSMAIPMRTGAKGTDAVIESLFQWYRSYGFPVALKMDCDSRFYSADFRKRCEDFQIFIVESAPYAHSSIALAERESINHCGIG